MTHYTYPEAYDLAMSAGQDAGNRFAGGTKWNAQTVNVSVDVFHVVMKALGFERPE